MRQNRHTSTTNINICANKLTSLTCSLVGCESIFIKSNADNIVQEHSYDIMII